MPLIDVDVDVDHNNNNVTSSITISDSNSSSTASSSEQREWILHVQSLQRVLRLLGQTFDPETGFMKLKRGFQTEALANQTLEWIWCGLDHCPGFMDLISGTNNVDNDYTNNDTALIEVQQHTADCNATIQTLMAVVSRNRQPFQSRYYDEALGYYEAALDAAVTVPVECVARSYLTKLYLQRELYDNATVEAQTLCEVCRLGAPEDPNGVAVRQAKHEFGVLQHKILGLGANPPSWPCPEIQEIANLSIDEETDRASGCSHNNVITGHMMLFVLILWIAIRR